MKAVWFGYALGATVCFLFAVIAAANVWPPMDGDGAMLFPSAVELARGNGFVNTPWVSPMNDTIDGPGGRRHISHGFLSQLLIGLAASLTGGDSPQCVTWSYIVVFLAAVVGGLALLSWRPAQIAPGLSGGLLGFLSVTGFFSLAFAWFGRVEPMVMLWVGCALLGLRFLPGMGAIFVCGAALGLMAWTSPMSAILGALLLGICMLLRQGMLSVGSVVLLVAGGVTATALSFAVYPYTLNEWIGGTIRHSRIHFDHPAFQGLLHTWVTRPHAPLLVITIGLLMLGSLLALPRLTIGMVRWRKSLFVICCLLFAVAVFRLTVVRGEAVYNIIPFLPVFAATALHGGRGFPGAVLLIAALVFPAVGLARSSVLLGSQVANGPRFEEVRQAITERVDEGLLVSKGLWLAVPELGRVEYGRPGFGRGEPRWFIDQQLATGRPSPATYPGYSLVLDRFSGPVKVFGLPISRAPTGWQYALYEKALAED